MGELRAAFVKPAKGALMRAVPALRLVESVGAYGDANASAGSTRQVLMVDADASLRLGLPPGALRENACVDMRIDGLASGTVLRLGSALLRVTYPCDPCALIRRYTGVPPARLAGVRGVLAVVIAGGVAAPGDRVVDEGVSYPTLPRDWRERVAWFLQRLPDGLVMTYGDLAAAVGEPPTVARTLPRLLTGARYAELPTSRVVASSRLAAAGEAPAPPRWEYWQAVYAPLAGPPGRDVPLAGRGWNRAVRPADLVRSSATSRASLG